MAGDNTRFSASGEETDILLPRYTENSRTHRSTRLELVRSWLSRALDLEDGRLGGRD